MSSLQTRLKQIPANAGYYINVGSLVPSVAGATLYYNVNTDAAPNMSTSIWALSTNTSTLMKTAGNAIFRDMGKTLLSSSRVFRKVQLLVSTGSDVNGGSDGVAGTSTAGADGSTPSYLTAYIELPGTGGYSSGSAGLYTPVARLG